MTKPKKLRIPTEKMSRQLRKDPSATMSVSKGIESEFKRALRIVRLEAKKLLKKLAKERKKVEVRELAKGDAVSIEFKDYGEKLGAILKIKLKNKLKEPLKRGTTQSYGQGKKRAESMLEMLNIEAAVGMLPVDRETLKMLEARDLSELNGISEHISKTLTEELSQGVMEGEGIYKLSRRIDEAITSIDRKRARLIARTETMTAYNIAAKNRFIQHGIREVEWFAAKQPGRTCDECKGYDGEIYPINDHPSIPAHPNCRCVLLPVIEEVS